MRRFKKRRRCLAAALHPMRATMTKHKTSKSKKPAARKKAAAALSAGLTPIVCVGESAAERKSEQQASVVKRQLAAALSALKPKGKDRVLIAYEPVWAIGTGDAATPNDAIAMHAFIRAFVTETFPSLAKRASVLYGGSVDGKNAYSFLREKEIEGVLVGGASVKMKEFEAVIAAACDVIEKQGE